jgi:hypothetical protein
MPNPDKPGEFEKPLILPMQLSCHIKRKSPSDYLKGLLCSGSRTLFYIFDFIYFSLFYASNGVKIDFLVKWS